VKITKKVDKLYEKQPGYKETIAQLKELTARLEVMQPQNYDEELSDCVSGILINTVNICREYKLTPEQILMDKIEEIIDYYETRK